MVLKLSFIGVFAGLVKAFAVPGPGREQLRVYRVRFERMHAAIVAQSAKLALTLAGNTPERHRQPLGEGLVTGEVTRHATLGRGAVLGVEWSGGNRLGSQPND